MQSLVPPVALLLLAGGVFPSDATPIPVERAVGGELFMSLLTHANNVSRCFITTPAGEDIEFIPDNRAGDKYELSAPSAVVGCAVTVKNLTANDTGIWAIKAILDNSEAAASYDLKVKSDNISDGAEVPNDQDVVTHFPALNFLARSGSKVPITLSKTDNKEECYLKYPNSSTPVHIESIEPDGVIIQGQSDYVSCMAIIGPMSAQLLGAWTLCGERAEEDAKHQRCQTVNIAWQNPNNPDAQWHTTIHPKFEHPVHFGGTVAPSVRGAGALVQSCHVVTPAGEDIVVTPSSEYPFLARLSERDSSVCSVAIGPIQASLLGEWEIYGVFSSGFSGQIEVRQPMNFVLYDEDNPYNQAYNRTSLSVINRIVRVGNTIEVAVSGSGAVDNCTVTKPNGEQVHTGGSTSELGVTFLQSGCRVSVGPLTTSMLGYWDLTGKFSNNGQFTEVKQPIHIIEEDPEHPFVDETKEIVQLEAQRLATSLGARHTISIPRERQAVESCHVRTPDQRQYKIMEGFNVSGVEVMQSSSGACGIILHIESKNEIGEWVLISRETSRERRLNFTISVEVLVDMVPPIAVVSEESNLYIRLREAPPANMTGSCAVAGPRGQAAAAAVDDMYSQQCGYVIRNVSMEHSGDWEITYGNKITFRAVSHVNVTARTEAVEEHTTWTLDAAVNVTAGPPDATYCRAVDPTGGTAYDGFGRCEICVERVAERHAGAWRLTVGLPGHVLTDTQTLHVEVVEPAAKPAVSTRVSLAGGTALLTCALPPGLPLQGCKFRGPRGQVLLAGQGVGEDRYNGFLNGLESVLEARQCGLRIKGVTYEDVGRWRCAVGSADNTYFGFLSLHDPEQDDPPAEPQLSVEQEEVAAVEGERVTLACTADAPLSYCYLRVANGTVYSVGPESAAAGVEYAGAGLDAGECALRFRGLAPRDSGPWSCHVGFADASLPEQFHTINVTIEALLTAQANLSQAGVTVQAAVYGQRALRHCRFVRIDGLGFNLDNLPKGYSGEDWRSLGACGLVVEDPTLLDTQPWVVAVRLRGQDAELSALTEPVDGFEHVVIHGVSVFTYLLCSFALITLGLVTLALSFRKSREWTSSGFIYLRHSFRGSIKKQPALPPQDTA